MLHEGRNPSIAIYCKKLQYLLEAGVDSNCYILLARAQNKDDPATHIISLKDLVEQLKPPNFEELSALLRKGERRMLNMSWRYLAGSSIGKWNSTSPKPHCSYIPFIIDTELVQPEHDWLAKYWTCTTPNTFLFIVH
jgi:hypothetical protein